MGNYCSFRGAVSSYEETSVRNKKITAEEESNRPIRKRAQKVDYDSDTTPNISVTRNDVVHNEYSSYSEDDSEESEDESKISEIKQNFTRAIKKDKSRENGGNRKIEEDNLERGHQIKSTKKSKAPIMLKKQPSDDRNEIHELSSSEEDEILPIKNKGSAQKPQDEAQREDTINMSSNEDESQEIKLGQHFDTQDISDDREIIYMNSIISEQDESKYEIYAEDSYIIKEDSKDDHAIAKKANKKKAKNKQSVKEKPKANQKEKPVVQEHFDDSLYEVSREDVSVNSSQVESEKPKDVMQQYDSSIKNKRNKIKNK